jgi:enolase-phosphatase E1
LHGKFFSDVRPALAAWRSTGISLYVFPSGSVRNQQDWLAHTRGVELASLISGWFDLATAGAKRKATSYQRIAEVIGLPAKEILFLSDHTNQFNATVAAGWAVHGVARAGEPNSPRPPHHWINSFAEVDPRQP